MTQYDYIKDILNIKDVNIHFYENCLEISEYKGVNTKIFHGFLTYLPSYCSKCGCVFESKDDFEKKGFDKGSYVVVPTIFKMTTFLFLKNKGFFVIIVKSHLV